MKMGLKMMFLAGASALQAAGDTQVLKGRDGCESFQDHV
jgi:hypothetical protein